MRKAKHHGVVWLARVFEIGPKEAIPPGKVEGKGGVGENGEILNRTIAKGASNGPVTLMSLTRPSASPLEFEFDESQAASMVIGPSGDVLSLDDPAGAVFTLNVPEDSVTTAREFALEPVGMGDRPLFRGNRREPTGAQKR